MRRLIVLILLITAISCGLLPPKRQYIKEAKQQVIPEAILNTYWALQSFDNKPPDCDITIGFLDKGQFIIKFKNDKLDGDHLWYVIKDTEVVIHTRPLEKIAWTSDDCEVNPASFARISLGEKVGKIVSNKLIFVTYDNKELVFNKL
ncbi:MAG: hypothetical protein ABI663_18345 [Chryseolinea sp.]